MATLFTNEMIEKAIQISDSNPFLEGFVPGEGALDPKFVMIGEAPGAKEAEQGHPFVGPSGKELNVWLDELGVTRDQIYITGPVRSRPFKLKNGRKSDRKPTPLEIQTSAPLFDYEMAKLKGHILVTLGNTGLERLIGGPVKITKMHGKMLHQPIQIWDEQNSQFKLSEVKYDIFPLYHPAYIRRFNSKRDEVLNDLIELKKFI